MLLARPYDSFIHFESLDSISASDLYQLGRESYMYVYRTHLAASYQGTVIRDCT